MQNRNTIRQIAITLRRFILMNNYQNAVDGNRGTDLIEDMCSHTAGGDTNPWWMVGLQAVYYIKTVRIFNRGMDKFGIGTLGVHIYVKPH